MYLIWNAQTKVGFTIGSNGKIWKPFDNTFHYYSSYPVKADPLNDLGLEVLFISDEFSTGILAEGLAIQGRQGLTIREALDYYVDKRSVKDDKQGTTLICSVFSEDYRYSA